MTAAYASLIDGFVQGAIIVVRNGRGPPPPVYSAPQGGLLFGASLSHEEWTPAWSTPFLKRSMPFHAVMENLVATSAPLSACILSPANNRQEEKK